MPEEALVAEPAHNPDAALVNGGTPAVNEMFEKYMKGMGNDKFNLDNPNPPPEMTAAPEDKTPADEKEKPELDKVEPVKEAAKIEPAKTEPAKTEPAKADAPIDPLTLELPRSASPKANEQFSKLKEAIKLERAKAEPLVKQLKDAQTQIEALKKNGNAPADYEQIKKERDEFSEALKVANVERHPGFKRYFDGKIAEATALAVDIVGPENKVALEAALKMQDGPQRKAAFDEILSQLPQIDAVELGGVLAQFRNIARERAAELLKAPQSIERIEAEKTAQTAAQQRQTVEKRALGVKIANDATEGMDSFKEIAGDDAHNEQVRNRRAFIGEFMDGKVEEKTIPLIPVMIGDYLFLKNKVMPDITAKLTALQDQLKTLTKATPAPKGGGDGGKAAADAAPEGEGFTAHYARLARGG